MQLPLTAGQFSDVFGRYNEAIWPAQVMACVPANVTIALAAKPVTELRRA